MVDLRLPHISQKFADDLEAAFAIFIGRNRTEKIPRIRQAICPDRAKLRQSKLLAIVFADVSTRGLLFQHHAKLQTTRQHADFARNHAYDAQLRMNAQTTLLRNHQHFAISVVEEAVIHRFIGSVDMDAHAGLHGRIAIAAKRNDSVHKIRRFSRNRQRVPAQLIWRSRNFSKWATADHPRRIFFIRLMRYRRLNAIGPGAPVDVARRGERSSAELLGVEAKRMLLRCILPLRQSPCNCLCGKFVGESRLILQYLSRHVVSPGYMESQNSISYPEVYGIGKR